MSLLRLRYFYLIAFAPQLGFNLSVVVAQPSLSDELGLNVSEQVNQLSETLLFAALETLAVQPVELSPTSPTLEMLRETQLLNEQEWLALNQHLNKFGPMASTYELMAVQGLSLPVIRRLLPYVKAGGVQANAPNPSSNRLLVRWGRLLEAKAGYSRADSSTRFTGPRFSTLLRHKFGGTRWRAGYSLQQDAGESYQFSLPNQLLFDHHSFYLQWHDPPGRCSNLILGDYEIRLGQGLTFSSGFGFGKGFPLSGLHKSGQRSKHYTSLDEDRFFRGVQADFAIGKASSTTQNKGEFDLTASLFYSDKKIDGLIQDSMADLAASDGLHRNQLERARRNQLSERIAGLALSSSGKKLKGGAYASFLHYGSPITKGEHAYQYFNFAGQQLISGGLHFSLNQGPMLFFGEAAASGHQRKALATVLGMLLTPAPPLDVVFHYRNFGRAFYAPYGNAIGEGSNGANESGLLLGLTWRAASRTSIAMMADHFSFPWLRYRIDAPSQGNEYSCQLRHEPAKNAVYEFRFKLTQKARNSATEIAQPYTLMVARLHQSLLLNPNLRWQNRLAISRFRQADQPTSGWLAYTDLRYRKLGSAFTMNTRLTIFQTDNWDTRLYAFENNVREAFYIPAFHGQGFRFYWLGRWRISQHFSLEGRYAITKWLDRNSIGSGLDEIVGSQKSDLTIQLIMSH